MNEKFVRVGRHLVNHITRWIRALPLTLPVPQLVKKFPSCYTTWIFIAFLTKT